MQIKVELRLIISKAEGSSVAGYTIEISGDAKTGFTITSKYTPETIDIKATKN